MTGFSGDEYLSFSKPKGINYEPRKRGQKKKKTLHLLLYHGF
jgi:hypothetical protein